MIRAGSDSRGLVLTSPTITVFDLEYTAWECSMARRWLAPGEFKEVVQIGAVSSTGTVGHGFDTRSGGGT